MSSSAFKLAIKEGKKAEKYVAGMFSSWNLKVIPAPQKYHPAYDGTAFGNLHGNEVRFSYEVKFDKKCSETGNIYIDINSLSKSTASILCICLNEPIDTVLVLPLQDALNYAKSHANIIGGEFSERSACIPKDQFINDLKPKVLTTK